MKKIVLIAVVIPMGWLAAQSQIDKSAVIDKKSTQLQIKATPSQTPPAPSVYSLTSARVIIRTGNDNKESPSGFTLFITENGGIWGGGRDLYTQQDQSGRGELPANATTEIPLRRYPNTAADAFTLTNLQNKGLKFTLYYYPSFLLDAWKIDAVTIVLEFKDQYGGIHSTMGTKTIQFNTPNGLLTQLQGKMKMVGTTDGFFTPMPVTITEK